MRRLAPLLVAAVVAAIVGLFALAPIGSGAVQTAAVPVPTCVKPTSNVTNVKLADYLQCLSRREEALYANAQQPGPTVTATSTVTVPGPTSTVTQTVTASPTSTPTTPAPTTPAPTEPTPTNPPSSGWPDASNTGVPAGTTLTTYTGPTTITVANTVIDGKVVNGSLDIRAAGVVIRNSIVNGTVSTDENSTGYSFTIADSEVRVGDRPGTGIGAVNFTVLRVEVTGGNRSINCWKNCDVRGSWVHNQMSDETGVYHESGIRMGANGTIVGNTIACDAPDFPPDAGCSAGLTGYGDFAAVTNMLIQGNYFPASTGGTCAYGGSSGGKPYTSGARDIRFIDNTFERRASSQRGNTCGYYFTIADWDGSKPGNVWTGNRYTDGTPVNP